MAEIITTNGYSVAVDDADAASVQVMRWFAFRPSKANRSMYARASLNGRVVLMHRLLTGVSGRHQLVDHRDGNGLNNLRSNLRIATQTQNQGNRSPKRGRRFKCVSFVKWLGKWRAYIVDHGRLRHIGCFATEEDAARAYDREAVRVFGEFARLNFPVTVTSEPSGVLQVTF